MVEKSSSPEGGEVALPDAAPITTAEARRIRETLGLNEYEFARAIGVTSKTVERWEAGSPDLQLSKLASEAILRFQSESGS